MNSRTVATIVRLSGLVLLFALIGARGAADAHGEPLDVEGLLDRLGSKEYEVWRAAQAELAGRGVEGVALATQRYLEGKIHEAHLGGVFGLVNAADAHRAIAELLTHENTVIRYHAASALADVNDEANADLLVRGIRRLIEEHRSGLTSGEGRRERDARRSATFWIPRALWGAKPNKESADVIVALADLYDEEERLDVLTAMNDTAGRAHLDVGTSIKTLFHGMRYMAGPESMEVRLGNGPADDFPLFVDADTQEFVLAHRDEVLALMRAEFADTRSNLSVLVLGFLKDEASVPAMAEQYLAAGGFYGWESSAPDIFGSNQYITHSVIEEAIEYITGESIEDVIVLSEKDIESLKTRADDGERAALYVLHRWRPDIARALLSKYQRTKTGLSTEAGYALMQHYVKDGMTMREVRALLGEPDRMFGSQWSYAFQIGGCSIGRLLFSTNAADTEDGQEGVLTGMSLSAMQAECGDL